MQDLEYTPSVYMADRTDRKANLSAQLFFELTCTAEKQGALPVDSIIPTIIDASPMPPPPPHAKIKTEDFFQDFENNFVVTFEEDKATAQEELARTATFQLGVESHCMLLSKTTDIELEAVRRDSFGEEKLSLRTGPSLVHTGVMQEKGSPVAFEVKKRTVFKAKENIFTNGLNFKRTQKKIFNQNIFEQFAGKTRACLLSTAHNSEKSLSSKANLRKDQLQPSHADFSLEPHARPSILERQTEGQRSATLGNWRKRFNRERQAMEGTSKRENIFHILTMR